MITVGKQAVNWKGFAFNKLIYLSIYLFFISYLNFRPKLLAPFITLQVFHFLFGILDIFGFSQAAKLVKHIILLILQPISPAVKRALMPDFNALMGKLE